MTSMETWLKAFGTYDIRALVGDVLTEETYYFLGKAFSVWLTRQPDVPVENRWVSVGYDARLHSPALTEALIRGLTETGTSVLDLGLCPTPVVYFSEYWSKEQQNPELPVITATLTVTASHNPAPYNGLKFTFQGRSFDREQLLALKTIFQHQPEQPVLGKDVAKRLPFNIAPAYLAYIEQISLPAQGPVRVVVDCGNATAGVVAREVYERLGYEPIMLFEEPDGNFPNHHPDPCVHRNLMDLSQKVRETGADLGIAFDGDSDRLGLVDEQGRIIPGDLILLLYAEALLTQQPEPQQAPIAVVSEVKCTQILFDQIEKLGGRAIMSPTGHAYIKQRMRTEDAKLGGELSGHFFFRDRHWGFDDAFYAGARILEILSAAKAVKADTAFSDLMAHLPTSILSEEQRVACPKESAPRVIQALRKQLEGNPNLFGKPMVSLVDIDGLRVNLEGGFVLIRPSNTEPCLTIRFEAPEQETYQLIEDQLSKVLITVLAELGLSVAIAAH